MIYEYCSFSVLARFVSRKKKRIHRALCGKISFAVDDSFILFTFSACKFLKQKKLFLMQCIWIFYHIFCFVFIVFRLLVGGFLFSYFYVRLRLRACLHDRDKSAARFFSHHHDFGLFVHFSSLYVPFFYTHKRIFGACIYSIVYAKKYPNHKHKNTHTYTSLRFCA